MLLLTVIKTAREQNYKQAGQSNKQYINHADLFYKLKLCKLFYGVMPHLVLRIKTSATEQSDALMFY